MCRSIKTLHNFTPPATDEEIRAASLPFLVALEPEDRGMPAVWHLLGLLDQAHIVSPPDVRHVHRLRQEPESPRAISLAPP